MSYWLLNNGIWIAVIVVWVLLKKNRHYLLFTEKIKKRVGYNEKKEEIKLSLFESKIRARAQDIKKRSPHDLNRAERILAPILRLKRYTGTIANLISMLRTLLAVIVALLVIIYLTGGETIIILTALFCFIVASTSDFLDGAMARALDEISRLGQIIDPLADKAILAAPLFTLGVIFLSDVIYWSIVRQELFLLIIAILKMMAHKLPFSIASRANYWGKAKTVFELVAAGFLFLCPFYPVFIKIADFLFSCSIPLAVGSLVGYLSSVKRLRIIN